MLSDQCKKQFYADAIRIWKNKWIQMDIDICVTWISIDFSRFFFTFRKWFFLNQDMGDERWWKNIKQTIIWADAIGHGDKCDVSTYLSALGDNALATTTRKRRNPIGQERKEEEEEVWQRTRTWHWNELVRSHSFSSKVKNLVFLFNSFAQLEKENRRSL
jgi:hypothetical protein